MNKMDYAAASIRLCWGPMLTLGKGCFWELFSVIDAHRSTYTCIAHADSFVAPSLSAGMGDEVCGGTETKH